MTIEEIVNRLDYLMRREHAKNALLPDGFPLENEVLEDEKALNAAIALLKTHPDAQPNEPLTLEEMRGMDGQPVWGADGKCYIINLENDYAADKYRGFRMLWTRDFFYRRPPEED